MEYKDLDPILLKWAKENKLHIYTECKDYEVRSLDIINKRDESFEVWFEISDNDIFINVLDQQTGEVETINSTIISFENDLKNLISKINSIKC